MLSASVHFALKRTETLHQQGQYEASLDLCLQIARQHPKLKDVWYNAQMNAILLKRWQEALDYAQKALACGEDRVEIFDTLAYALYSLKQFDKVRDYGLTALRSRDHHYNVEPIIPLPAPEPMPPLPSARRRERNIIAFSLFGCHPKYCETAVWNTREQADIYPHWVCRFYVDSSVPRNVIERLRQGGAQIVWVEGAASEWPGPMWRLLALDDPLMDRVLFRDADSVISRREAAAVEQWLTSGKRFHMMRDHASHVALILAGMWGVVRGSLPPLKDLMQHFMSKPPLTSRRVADQTFLMEYVWPYARASLMQHDSVFGFMDAVPFPEGETSDYFFVGGGYETESLLAKLPGLPDGLEVFWQLYRIEKRDNGTTREELVCTYPSTVQNGTVKADVPARYVRWIRNGTARICGFVPPGAGKKTDLPR